MRTEELVIGGVLLLIGLVIGVPLLFQAQAMEESQREVSADEYQEHLTGAVAGLMIATVGVALASHGVVSKKAGTIPIRAPKVLLDAVGFCAYCGASVGPTEALCQVCGKKVLREQRTDVV